MASGEKVVLPAVSLNSAGILPARKVLSYLQTSLDSRGAQTFIPTARGVAQL